MAKEPKLEDFSSVAMRVREFTLNTYNNLPNTLLITSLLLGAIQGNLSMVWVSVGMVVNGIGVVAAQEILGIIFPTWMQVWQPGSRTCSLINDIIDADPAVIVAPSYWFASTTFFVIFILYNAIQVATRPATAGADQSKVDVRVAFSMSVIMLSIFFFFLLLLRGLTGCETWFGTVLGILIGAGISIGYWHVLDVCHSGIPPDILNVVTSLAPATSGQSQTPVICTA